MITFFRSNKGIPYAYSCHDNQFFRVDEVTFAKFSEFESIDDYSPELKQQLTAAGINISPLTITTPEELKKAAEKAAPGIMKLMISLTHQCNFRCRYCVYSGSIEKERPHENIFMQQETADKIVETFVTGSQHKPLSILFTGGEPLLNFPILKHIVEKVKLDNNITRFGITSNGLLLEKKEIVDFLVENNFWLTVSFDGPAHKLMRLDQNNNETYERVLANIQNIKENYPDFFRNNFASNVVITPAYSIKAVADYFHNSPVYKDVSLNISPIYDPNDSLSNKIGSKMNYDLWRGEIDELRSEFEENYGKVKQTFNEGLFLSFMARINDRSMGEGGPIPQGFCCYPGKSTLFIDTDGQTANCERAELYKLGNVHNTAVNTDTADEMANIYYQYAQKYCQKCFAARICNRCFANVGRGNLTEENFASGCDNFRTALKKAFRTFISIKDRDKNAFNGLDEFGLLSEKAENQLL